MPGKPRQRKGKYSTQAMKHSVQTQSDTPTQSSDVASKVISASSPSGPVTPLREVTPEPRTVVIQHPFIAAELKTIGLFSLGVLAVLVALTFIIS